MIVITIPGQPPTTTAQTKRMRMVHGKPVFFASEKVRDAEIYYERGLLDHVPDVPIEGPVKLTVLWQFKVTRGHKHGDPKTTKPDTDNMVKLPKDVLTKLGFWHDDAQVAEEHLVKVWADTPGTTIWLEGLKK